LEILAERGGANDLPDVRTAVSNDRYRACPSLFRYFGRFGEWEDVELILDLAKRGPPFSNFLDYSDRTSGFLKAAAICLVNLGKDRLPDLMKAVHDSDVEAYVLASLPRKAFVTLSDEAVLDYLRDKRDDFRKIAALKLISFSTIKRIKMLLQLYTSDGAQYFYNVIFWFDLRISLGAQAASAARILIAHKWL
jgi:hypothetical protein